MNTNEMDVDGLTNALKAQISRNELIKELLDNDIIHPDIESRIRRMIEAYFLLLPQFKHSDVPKDMPL